MYEHLKGKRLLFLGAIRGLCEPVLYAKKMGIQTVVIDYYPDSPAKRVADEAYLVSTTDVDAVVRLCKEKHIDGLFTGYIDSMLPYALEICERMGYPCYFNRKVLGAFNNKRGLKDILRKHGLPVIDEYGIDEIPGLPASRFPLLVKPTDSSGSKGMSVISSAEEFPAAYKKALSFSKKKDILVERFMKCGDMSFGYMLQNGEVCNLFTSDRYVNAEQEGLGSICSALVYPSKHTSLFQSTIDPEMRNIFRELDYKDGYLYVSAFVDNGKIMCYDPSVRLTGGREYLYSDHFYGVNLLECLFNYSLTGSMADENVVRRCDLHYDGHVACTFTVPVKLCTIGKLEGFDYVENHRNVLHVIYDHVVGDEVYIPGTLQQNVAWILVIARSREELHDAVLDLESHIAVYDTEGNNVTLGLFDPEEILK